MFEIEHYLTETGRSPFAQWYDGLRERKAKQAIDRRLNRMVLGNFGDCKPCRDGVWEMRIDFGPGLRVYYARHGQALVLLLAGGDKRTQQADISRACDYWQQFRQLQSRNENDNEDTSA